MSSFDEMLKAFAYPEIVKRYNEENNTEYSVEQCIPFIKTGDDWKEGIDEWVHNEVSESIREFLIIDYEEILSRQDRWDDDIILFFKHEDDSFKLIEVFDAIKIMDINLSIPLMFYMRKGSVSV